MAALALTACATVDAPLSPSEATLAVDAPAQALDRGCRGNSRARDMGATPKSSLDCAFEPVAIVADLDTLRFGAEVGASVVVTLSNPNPVAAVVYDVVFPPQLVRTSSTCRDKGRTIAAEGSCTMTYSRVAAGAFSADVDHYYWVTLADGTGWYPRLRLRAIGD